MGNLKAFREGKTSEVDRCGRPIAGDVGFPEIEITIIIIIVIAISGQFYNG